MAAQTNGDNDAPTSVLDNIATKVPAGTVLPPRSIREFVEKTAGYVLRNGARFEENLREKNKGVAQWSFLFPEDAYYPYYQWRTTEIKAGRGTSIAAGRKEGEVSFQGKEKKGPEKPEDFIFSARMPNISAQDLEVVKLTALFVAKNGRSWMTALSQREAGNFQFDFLRPQHSLYQFFSRLVDQYTELLNGGSVDEGRPRKKRMTELEANVKNRFRVLESARRRAEWVKYQEAQKVAQEEQDEKERVSFAQIDWHDFVVVETVVFDERDENTELPAPTSLNDLQSASLEQKAAMRINSNRRIEEAFPSFDDQEHFYGQTQPAPSAQPVQQPRAPSQTSTPIPPQSAYQPPSPGPDQPKPSSRTPNPTSQQPVKIRKDYTPAALQRTNKQPANTSICPNCRQAIPNDQMDQHLRIEMLDPNWRDQYKLHQQRSSTTNLNTVDVANNLKRLASQRTDVFEAAVREDGRNKRVEMDSAANSGGPGMSGNATAAPGPGQENRGSLDVQEQIRLIHERARKG